MAEIELAWQNIRIKKRIKKKGLKVLINNFLIYVFIIITMILSFGGITIYLLNKKNLINIKIGFSILLSSMVSSIFFPFILNYFFNLMFSISNILAFFATLVIYIIIFVIISVFISCIKFDKVLNKGQTQIIYEYGDDILMENSGKPTQEDKNIVEKAVDTSKITDTIGLDDEDEEIHEESQVESLEELDILDADNGIWVDAKVTEEEIFALLDNEDADIDAKKSQENKEFGVKERNVELLDINEIINESFLLKEKGDFEGAIVNYMYALDKKPDDSLVFWIVLDICVLYKNLGQIELATSILEGYADKYGHVMDEAILLEIKKNLI